MPELAMNILYETEPAAFSIMLLSILKGFHSLCFK
jgi:hypothetical protein